MTAQAKLFLPPSALASCLAAGIYRCTVGADLPDEDRMNYFPATPVYAVTRIFEGQLQMNVEVTDVATLARAPAMPPVSAIAPQASPVCSWSPAGMRAITIGVFPDAWAALGGAPDAGALPPAIKEAVMAEFEDPAAYWERLCAALAPAWERARRDHPELSSWSGSHRIADWTRHIATAAAMSGAGRSLRSVERRVRRWTGHSRQSLDFFARIEALHEHSLASADAPLARIAAEAEFSDQSHMGRAVKRATGFTPAQINRRIATEEPFWCYRLLGERF